MNQETKNQLIPKAIFAINELRVEALRDEKKEKNIFEEILEYKGIKEHITAGKLKNAISQPNSLAVLDITELYWALKGCNEYCEKYHYKCFDINLESFFTQEEINLAQQLKTVTDNSNILKIKALQKGVAGNPEWIGIMTFEEITNASKKGLMKYNLSTQRLADLIISDGKAIYIPDINESTVESIANSILKKKFISNTITLNILKTEDQSYINETEDDGFLTIDTSKDELDIIDGMHRIKGIVKAWQTREKQIMDGIETNQISGTMAVCVKNISEEEARSFIYQESLANKQASSMEGLYGSSALSTFYYELSVKSDTPYYKKLDKCPSDDKQISYTFATKFMDDMGSLGKFKTKTNGKTKSVLALVKKFSTFSKIVMEELKTRDDYQQYERIFEGQCFLVGMMSYYIYYMDYVNYELSEADQEVFIKRVVNMESPMNLQFDYPLVDRTQKTHVKKNYKSNK